jgi:uncharacterized protein
MKLDNEFTVAVPVSQAWDVLTDLERIAPCMPGAQLTGVTDGVYTGKVKIKVGPVTAEYSGTAQFSEKDDAAYRAVINARGRDARGNGNATAVISAQLEAAGDRTAVHVTTDLTIAGRIAQFGSGMIKEVSAKLLGQFVQCLERTLGESAGEAGATGTAGAAASSEPVVRSAAITTANGAAAIGGLVPVDVAAGAEPAPLDLMSVAGRAVYKRLAGAVAGLAVVALVIWLIVR